MKGQTLLIALPQNSDLAMTICYMLFPRHVWNRSPLR